MTKIAVKFNGCDVILFKAHNFTMSAAARAIILAFERLPPREQKLILFKLGAWFEFGQERLFHFAYPKVKKVFKNLFTRRRQTPHKRFTPSKHRFFHRNSPNFIWD